MIYQWSETDGWEYLCINGKTYRRRIGNLGDWERVIYNFLINNQYNT